VTRLVPFLIASAALAQDFANVKAEKIAAGLHYADGPAWSPEGFLLFTDSVADKLHKFVAGKGDSDFGEAPGGAMGHAYDTRGSLYTCEFRERRVTRMLKSGKREVLAARFEGKRLNAPNDVVVRRDGSVYFTDPAFGNQEDARELDFYGIFHITPKGAAQRRRAFSQRPHSLRFRFRQPLYPRI
jgi:gluconolactonase